MTCGGLILAAAIAARLTALVGGEEVKPYLRRVAFLESHGQQSMMTSFDLGEEKRIVFDAEWTAVSGEMDFVGTRDKTGMQNGMVVGNYNFFIFFYNLSQNRIDSAKFSGVTRHLIEAGYANGFKFLKIDGALVGSNTAQPPISKRLTLFEGGHGEQETQLYNPSRMKLFSLVGYDGERAEISLIPVLDLDGRPCMYDEVSGHFFYNQGTGEFTWGELP